MLITLFFVTFVTMTVQAATRADTLAKQFGLNQASPEQMRKQQLGTSLVMNRVHDLKAIYDFSVLGGALNATLTLRGDDGKPVIIPKNAVIIDCYIDVLTPLTTSASGTMALQAQAANDLHTALAAASYTGIVACVPVGTAASAIKMTSDGTLKAVIATGAITAGKFNLHVQYVMSE